MHLTTLSDGLIGFLTFLDLFFFPHSLAARQTFTSRGLISFRQFFKTEQNKNNV